VSEESPAESQQDIIEPNIDPELQSTPHQEASQDTTEMNANTAVFMHPVSLQDNIDPDLVDIQEPKKTPWNLEAQSMALDNGSGSYTQQGDVLDFE